jgi:hypothetical protein
MDEENKQNGENSNHLNQSFGPENTEDFEITEDKTEILD